MVRQGTSKLSMNTRELRAARRFHFSQGEPYFPWGKVDKLYRSTHILLLNDTSQ